jgi:hypothetical protein
MIVNLTIILSVHALRLSIDLHYLFCPIHFEKKRVFQVDLLGITTFEHECSLRYFSSFFEGLIELYSYNSLTSFQGTNP